MPPAAPERRLAAGVALLAGKVRYVGCSRLAAWQLHDALGRSAVLGVPGFVSMQLAHSVLARQCEAEVLDACAAGSVGVPAFSVLAGGTLGGLYAPGAEYEAGQAPGLPGAVLERRRIRGGGAAAQACWPWALSLRRAPSASRRCLRR